MHIFSFRIRCNSPAFYFQEYLLFGKIVQRNCFWKIAENDKLIISVKAHEKTKYADYVAVIDQLKMANAKRISIAETD